MLNADTGPLDGVANALFLDPSDDQARDDDGDDGDDDLDDDLDLPDDWVFVDASGEGDYLHPEDALAAGETRIQVLAGVYELYGVLDIEQDDVMLVGEGADVVELIQRAPTDGVRIYADNVVLSGMTIDTRTHQAEVAVVLGDAEYNTVEDNRILGPDHTWAVYVAGPEHEVGTLDDLLVDASLDHGNIVRRNDIESSAEGDVVSFAGQRDGRVEDNIITGQLNIFLCRDTLVIDNWIEESHSTGITINLPTWDTTLERNTIIWSEASGIRVGPQDIHPIALEERSPGLLIQNNVIVDTHYMGIELDGTTDAVIRDNLVDSTHFDGIYLLRSDGASVVDNDIDDAGLCGLVETDWSWPCGGVAAIYLDSYVTDSAIEYNLMSNLGGAAEHAVRVENDRFNSGNFVGENTTEGTFLSGELFLGDDA
jgi:parallel beta-helix repeat protein